MRKIFSISTLILGIAFFAVFMVAACAAYYMTAGVFVTARLAVLYAVLGLAGALAVVFRRYIFAVLFYLGCALGWVTGNYIGGLEGEFAPTAGVIATFFLIGCFALVGLVLEISRVKRGLLRRTEKREAERQEEQQALLARQEAAAGQEQQAEAEAKAAEPAAPPPEAAPPTPSGQDSSQP